MLLQQGEERGDLLHQVGGRRAGAAGSLQADRRRQRARLARHGGHEVPGLACSVPVRHCVKK
jgi:hypothetical protein